MVIRYRFIIEGPDRAGKSTLANALIGRLHELGEYGKLTHCDKDTIDWSAEEVNGVLRDSRVIDRLYDSEFVYSGLFRTQRYDLLQLMELRRLQYEANACTVFVTAPPDVIRSRYAVDDGTEHYVSCEQSVAAAREYQRLYSNVSRPVHFIRVDNPFDPAATARAIVDYAEDNMSGSDRPCKLDWLMQMAWLCSVRATCERGRVGCVLTDPDGVIVSTGYNGVRGHGTGHCRGCERCEAVHAEANALDHAHDKLSVGIAVVTCSPCGDCARRLVMECPNLRFVYFHHVHHNATKAITGLDCLVKAGVSVSVLPTKDKNEHRLPPT